MKLNLTLATLFFFTIIAGCSSEWPFEEDQERPSATCMDLPINFGIERISATDSGGVKEDYTSYVIAVESGYSEKRWRQSHEMIILTHSAHRRSGI